MSRTESMSRESLLEFLRLNINDQRTLNTYIREGILPEPTIIDKKQYFSRAVVLKLMGCKRDPDEPFITSGECADMLGIDRIDIAGYTKRKNIPYYRLGSKKGHRTLYLKSEVNAAITLDLCWFGLDNYKTLSRVSYEILAKLICSDFVNIFSDIDKLYLKAILIDRISFIDFAKSQKVSRETIRQRFEQAYLNFTTELNNIEKEIKNTQSNLSIIEQQRIEIKHLKETNERLFGIVAEKTKIAEISKNIVKPMHLLDLSKRIRNFFKSNDIEDLYQLSQYERSFIVKFRNLGQKTVDELDQLLIQNGLTWKVLELYKIIGIDNFNRDYISDELIQGNFSKETADKIVLDLNGTVKEDSFWRYKAVPMSYELHDAYKDLP